MGNNGEQITIDQLARMVQKGFEETATKQDLKNEIEGLRSEMNKRFDRIENILLEEHRRRIEKLEDKMQEVRDALAMK